MRFFPRRAALFLAAAFAFPLMAGAQSVECAPLPPASLTLPSAEERLRLCNRDVRAAELAAIAAAADRRIAGQRPNPTFTLGASNVNPQAGIGSGNLRDKTFDSSVRIEQLVERGGKAELREAQADRLLDAARADVAELQLVAVRHQAVIVANLLGQHVPFGHRQPRTDPVALGQPADEIGRRQKSRRFRQRQARAGSKKNESEIRNPACDESDS